VTSPRETHPSDSDAAPVAELLDRAPSEEELASGARWAARPPDRHEGSLEALLLVRLGEEVAALPVRRLRRVTPYARPTPIPHRTGGVMRGVCNIRGELVLCADLRLLLGLPPAAAAVDAAARDADPRRMVVIGPADASWVFEVDAVLGVERVAPASIGPPPVTVRYAMAGSTRGVLDLKDQRVTVLDGERLLKGFQASLA